MQMIHIKRFIQNNNKKKKKPLANKRLSFKRQSVTPSVIGVIDYPIVVYISGEREGEIVSCVRTAVALTIERKISDVRV